MESLGTDPRAKEPWSTTVDVTHARYGRRQTMAQFQPPGRQGIAMKHRIIGLGTAVAFGFILGSPARAQGPCPPPVSENLLAIWNLHQAGAYELPNDTGWTYGVPVTFHLAHNAGVLPDLDQGDLDLLFADLNLVLQDADMEFFQQGTPDPVEGFYVIDCIDEFEAFTTTNRVPGTLNVYFADHWLKAPSAFCGPPAPGPDCTCGESAFSVSDAADQFMILRYACVQPDDLTNVTWMHETGHYFDLLHTFEPGIGPECPDGSNCDTCGDLVCDTPPDVGTALTTPPECLPITWSGCTYTGSALNPCTGLVYAPDATNLMGNSPKACRNQFSPDQLDRMRATLVNLRPDHIGWARVEEVTDPGAAAGDHFGDAVSLGGSTALVGIPEDDGLGQDAGRVQFFHRSGPDWLPLVAFADGDAAPVGDRFGAAVGIAGRVAAVGCPGDDGQGTAAGKLYVYEKLGGTWVLTAELVASDGAAGFELGSSIAVVGERVVAGAPGATGAVAGAGAAYVFEKGPTGWAQLAKLQATSGQAGDEFGASVAFFGTTVAVGAPEHGVGGSVFTFAAGGGAQSAQLTAADAQSGDRLGASLSMTYYTILAGAPLEDDGGTDAGACYIFENFGSGWSAGQKLVPAGVQAGDLFGWSVSLANNNAIVGTPLGATDSGTVHLLGRRTDGWVTVTNVQPEGPEVGSLFGYSVALSGTSAVMGHPLANAPSTDSGAATFFEIPELENGWTLTADVEQISVSAGGTQTLTIDAGPTQAGKTYLLLGSMSGTTPGQPYGPDVLPLNLDSYFNWTLNNPNTPPLGASLGTLDANGRATATFTLGPGSPPSYVGLTLNHAFVVLETPTFASPPVALELIP